MVPRPARAPVGRVTDGYRRFCLIAARMNESDIHIDFMIGRPDLTVTGITRDGERVPVLVDGSWRI